MHKRTTPKIFRHATPSWRTVPRKNYIATCLQRKHRRGSMPVWKHLRAHRIGDVHFRNHTCPGGRCQGHAIGKYIVDFSQRDAVQCAPRKKLIIELDGSQHLEQKDYDEERTKYLELRGYRVLRFQNNDITNNIHDVLKVIWRLLREENEEEKRQP